MTVYLKDIPLAEAQARFEKSLQNANLCGILGVEEIPLDEKAAGRVLAEPVWAKISSPHYHGAAMDGFAVRSESTDNAMPTSPVTLKYGDQAHYVDTGDPLPAWANAVIPIENVEPLDGDGQLTGEARQPEQIRIRAGVPPWSHVRSMGEDIVATQLVLPAGHILRPVDLGSIAACGHTQLMVARQPKVAILPTGSELVTIGEEVKAGDIIEYNSLVMAAQINDWGGQATRFSIIPDKFEHILEEVSRAAESYDLVLLNAGSSAGSEDFSADVVETLGDLLVHGVAVRPGHPVILGMIKGDRMVPIIGVPGYPVSAALTGEIFIEPLIARWLGRRKNEPIKVQAKLTRKITSPAGDDDFVRVVVGRVGERILAAPLARGAGLITSLVRADGLALIPRGSQGLAAGEEVEVKLYRSPLEIERTIFAIGSHDLTLDIMAQYLALKDRRLSSANVGSLGGLLAIRRQEAHLAGSHLLDPESGEYNIAYIKQYLSGIPVVVITLVNRQQGILVLPENPKSVNRLDDLVRKDISFINRQRGAGTRVLLDYHLKLLGIDQASIQGYDQEEYTHLAVAAAVASGRADCGLGIAAAARALNLDFIPLFEERYDLVIAIVHYHSSLLQPLLDLVQDESFRKNVASLPGYDVANMGKVVAEIK
jgi:putative molybdopterin biosynthesis protein